MPRLVLFAALIGGFWAADHYFLHGRFTDPISDAVISGAQILNNAARDVVDKLNGR
jgi:hypothetical protein